MTAPEAQLVFARTLLLVLLYGFLGLTAWIAWRELRAHASRPGSARTGAASRVVVLAGGESGWPTGTAFALQPTTVIGRDLDAGIVLQDATLSGRHAVVARDDGGWWVEDVGSTNGTYLNGEQIDPASPAPLRSGDILRCGNVELRVVLVSEPVA
jgi:hypothetical protein